MSPVSRSFAEYLWSGHVNAGHFYGTGSPNILFSMLEGLAWPQARYTCIQPSNKGFIGSVQISILFAKCYRPLADQIREGQKR